VTARLLAAWKWLLVLVGWPVEDSRNEHPEVKRARERAERIRRSSPLVAPEDAAYIKEWMDSIGRDFDATFAGLPGATVTRTERHGRVVTCGACRQKNTVYFDEQGLRLCAACGLPLARVRYRGGR